ncbi:hypothetical protein BWD42_04455 [Sphingobacterium sp. CZ-UAM]|nr:hypothetical protein BWD42_04455 [Sphingobacterium sp. CZ-UAM]
MFITSFVFHVTYILSLTKFLKINKASYTLSPFNFVIFIVTTANSPKFHKSKAEYHIVEFDANAEF